MDFLLETIFLIALAFVGGALVGLVLRRRARRRSVSRLAGTVLLSTDETEVPPAAPAEPPPSPARDAREQTPRREQPLAPQPPLAAEAQASPGSTPPEPSSARRPRERQKAPAGGGDHPGRAPPSLTVPDGKGDDLKRLKGIGPQNERRLNALGIFHIAQIAAWSRQEAQWIGAALGFPGRVERENWVAQANAIISAVPVDGQDTPLFHELKEAAPQPRPKA